MLNFLAFIFIVCILVEGAWSLIKSFFNVALSVYEWCAKKGFDTWYHVAIGWCCGTLFWALLHYFFG